MSIYALGCSSNPHGVRVFLDRDSALQYAAGTGQPAFIGSSPHPPQTLRAGAMVTWDGTAWRVANIGTTTVLCLAKAQGCWNFQCWRWSH